MSASTHVDDYHPSKATDHSLILDMRHNCTFRAHAGATGYTLQLAQRKIAKWQKRGAQEFLDDCCIHLYPHMRKIMTAPKTPLPLIDLNELHRSLLKIAAVAQTDKNWAICVVTSVGVTALEGSPVEKSGYWVLLEALKAWLDNVSV